MFTTLTGGAIAKIVNAKKDQYGVRASVESTGGSKFNINAIDSKDLDFGIAQADTQYMAYNGKGAWEGKPVKKLRAVFALARSRRLRGCRRRQHQVR